MLSHLFSYRFIIILTPVLIEYRSGRFTHRHNWGGACRDLRSNIVCFGWSFCYSPRSSKRASRGKVLQFITCSDDNKSFKIGAGLQITPNGSRLLQGWNLPQHLWDQAAEPTILTVHRYSGMVLARESDFHKNIRQKYGAPFIDLHRVDLQRALYDRARELGVIFHLDERVEDINSAGPSVISKSGQVYEADLVVGADGLWSRTRECFLGMVDQPKPTGDLAYRIVLSIDQIEDPALKSWISKPEVHFWIGPGSHAVGYSLKGGDMYNIVLLVPDDLPPGVAKQSGNVEEMKKLFENWDPV